MRLAACEAARLPGDMSRREGERSLPLETRMSLLFHKLMSFMKGQCATVISCVQTGPQWLVLGQQFFIDVGPT